MKLISKFSTKHQKEKLVPNQINTKTYIDDALSLYFLI